MTHLNKYIVDVTRQLRRNQTESENELWQKLRNRKFKNLKFLQQHPIVYGKKGFTPLFFVADFYCDAIKLVVELDGKVHDFQKDYDENRDAILRELGLRVLRIKNEELNDLKSVLNKIASFATSPSLQSREGMIPRSGIGGELSIILLAAGSSSRMGQSKQLLPWENETLLERSVKTAIQSRAHHTVVVLGANEEAHHSVVQNLPVDVVVNPDWQKGMGSSLKTGLNHIIKTYPQTPAVIVMVCDQPFVTSNHLDLLIEQFIETGKNIIASKYAETLGVPALFSKDLFDEIIKLDDQHGAKKLIQKFSNQTGFVLLDKGQVDIDTLEDWQNLKSS